MFKTRTVEPGYNDMFIRHLAYSVTYSGTLITSALLTSTIQLRTTLAYNNPQNSVPFMTFHAKLTVYTSTPAFAEHRKKTPVWPICAFSHFCIQTFVGNESWVIDIGV